MNEENKKYYKSNRTEEVQDIIDRIPTNFGVWVSIISISIVLLLLIFGWFIKYPDVIIGRITINSTESPVKLVANSHGKIRLNGIKSFQNVKEGEIIAYLQNPGELKNILLLNDLLKKFNPETSNVSQILSLLPDSLSFGELNIKYALFLNSLNEFNNYNVEKLFDKQTQNLHELLKEQNNAIGTGSKLVEMNSQNLEYVKKFIKRDSTLFVKRVISEAEFDKTQMNYLSNKEAYQNSIGELINNKQNAQVTEGRIKEIKIQKSEKLKELKIAIITNYNDLIDNIKAWEQKYVFRAPFDGQVQFLNFWIDNQFIQSGEHMFTLIPKMGKPIGQALIPTIGAGKVFVGQEAIVKLEKYPYNEYGSIKGIVNSISLSTNISKTSNGDLENYLIIINFPNDLKTNYGTKLNANLDMKGTVEIITKDRRLIQRIFDNLNYAIKK